MRHSKNNSKPPQLFDSGLGVKIEYKSGNVLSLVYIIQYNYYDSNVDTDKILSLLYGWDSEYVMDDTSTYHMRESCTIKYQSRDTYDPTYMKEISGEYANG